ncbi:hypothetical protein Tco_1174242 [Tanacetum coccineum]
MQDTYWVMLEEGRITQYAANILKQSIDAALNLVPAEPLCDWNGLKSDVQIPNHLKFLQTCTFPQKLVTYNIVEREDTQAHWPTESGLITVEEASFDIFKFLDKIWGTLSSSRHDVTGPKQASNVDSAICALLNYTTSSLSIVAVATLSCEALKTDCHCFNFFTDCGDGFSDKDRAIEELGEKLREGVNYKKSMGTQLDMEKKLVEAENAVKKLLERALHLHIDVVGVEVLAGVAAADRIQRGDDAYFTAIFGSDIERRAYRIGVRVFLCTKYCHKIREICIFPLRNKLHHVGYAKHSLSM